MVDFNANNSHERKDSDFWTNSIIYSFRKWKMCLECRTISRNFKYSIFESELNTISSIELDRSYIIPVCREENLDQNLWNWNICEKKWNTCLIQAKMSKSSFAHTHKTVPIEMISESIIIINLINLQTLRWHRFEQMDLWSWKR